MACRHNNEVDKCDECRATAERREVNARGLQRASESRRIQGRNTPNENK
jgi:hypothetical protein